MNEPDKQDTEFVIPLSDIVKVLKRKKLIIGIGAVTLATLFGGYALLKPIKYQAEATFKEKANSHSPTSSGSLTSLILGGLGGSSGSEAKTMMGSKKLLQQIVRIFSLQAAISRTDQPSGWIHQAKENISVEINYLTKRKELPLPDLQIGVSAKNIDFPGEFALAIRVDFDSENSFQLFDRDEQKIGSGRLGTPFTTRDYSFTLSKTDDLPLKNQTFILTLIPLNDITEALSKTIKIETEKDDPNLLKLTYTNRDRHLASAILNQLMTTYQDYLKTEQHRIASEQIHYLNQRESEMGQDLENVIQDYAKKLSEELSGIGYADSEKAIEFLTNRLQSYNEKRLGIDLDLKRLSGVLYEGTDIQMDAYIRSDSNPSYINSIIQEISLLKQQADSKELAIRTFSSKEAKKWQSSFHQQVAEIEEIQQCKEDACLILANLGNNHPIPKTTLEVTPEYLVSAWNERLQSLEEQWGQSTHQEEKQATAKELHLTKEQFANYLSNLVHYLEVREKAIKERLSHQQAPQGDFQGIDLNTGNELYITYSKQLSNIEADILQFEFLINELQNPDFEISSLSSVITDPVTRKLIDSASLLVQSLQDDINRSIKENERTKQELQIKRRFLTIHLKQTIDLLNLKADLIKEKIQSIQNATLELIQQRISILEKQLFDSIKTHITNLKEEDKLIARSQSEIKSEMATLPEKWAGEKLIEHQLKMNTAMVEEVTKLVESKNISSNLEMVQSTPVDISVPPVRPLRPKFVFFSLIGAILGALMTSGFVVIKNLLTGFPVSQEGLELAGFHVSGTLTSSQTLKRLASFLSQSDNFSLLMTIKKNKNHPEQLAKLLKGKGLKVLILNLYETKPSTDPQKGCLFDPVDQQEHYDLITSHVKADHLFEAVTSQKFKERLSELQKDYDCVIGVTTASPKEIEVETMIPLFDSAAISLSDETMDQLYTLLQTIKEKGKQNNTSFLIMEAKSHDKD